MSSCVYFMCVFFFFFKQKTAYVMRISDWSSGVCSSDLGERYYADGMRDLPEDRRLAILAVCTLEWRSSLADALGYRFGFTWNDKIGRASCRERVCQYV